MWRKIAAGAAVLAGGASALAYGAYRSAMREAEEAHRTILLRPAPPPERFDPHMVAGLPEIAQRYFRHAIAPGTPLRSAVELEMEGTFLLGDKDKHQSYRMTARQALRAPEEFIWAPRLRSGAMTITGSDALVGGEAWTRFWLLGLVPVANVRTSPDLVRSARFRGAVESALWLPASLLPGNRVRWEQTGPNRARITLERFDPAIVLDLTLAETGAVREVVGQRWSDANPEKRFRLQPFGGAVSGESTFDGFTIPSAVAVGNHYGTERYLPFFQARITAARYR